MALRDCVVTAQNGPSVTPGLLLGMFRPLGPKTRREVRAEVTRPLRDFGGHVLGQATVASFPCHRHRPWGPPLACSWALVLSLSLSPAQRVEDVQGNWVPVREELPHQMKAVVGDVEEHFWENLQERGRPLP